MRCTKSLLLLLAVLFAANVFAQRNCSSMDVLEHQLATNPKMATKMERLEKFTQDFVNDPDRMVAQYTIPVVFHVVYRTNAENISDAQIQTQLDVLNEDYRRLNSDADNTWSQAADTEIEFCLAQVDPNGNPTTGITRTSTTVNGFGTNDAVKSSSSGGVDAWNTSQYLNIWVCNIGGGILGYAQFPGGPSATDGVVNGYQYTGTIGTAQAPFNLGRTLTHEVGHYLNLRHIWGDGGCNVDDGVSDTPQSDAANYGCATNHTSCNTTDMVQNYMDYSDDGCMNLFTAGQKARMHATLNSSRSGLDAASALVCAPPAPPTCDDGIQNQDETGVDCGGATCPECPPCTTVTLVIDGDTYGDEITWDIVDANGATVASGGPYAETNGGFTANATSCLVDGCYDFTIYDSYGDGLNDNQIQGTYTLTHPDGTVLATGTGNFGSSATTNFCISDNSTVPGCTNPAAHNYDPNATEDDGSCKTCDDGILNGDETDVDCGGALCAACPTVTCDAPVATATVISGGCVKLDWPAMANATEYRCRYRPVGGTWIQYNASFDLSFLNDLTIGGSYEFQVKTKCGSTNSVWSNTVAFTTASDNCDRPNTVTLSNVTATGCDVSWSQDPDDLKYKVGYKLVSGSTWTQIFVSLPNTSYTIAGLASGADYKVRVKTKCSGGWTNWTAKEDLTTLASAVSNNARMGNFVANVYPNPVNETLNIDYNLEADGKVSIQVFDILGKAVITSETNQVAGANNTQLDVSRLTSGNHFVHIQSGTQQIVKKFVKF